jgi:hypothetical protein
MKERPLLFSGPMVRALLNGSKTETRRVFKSKNGGVQPRANDLPGMRQILRNCPYGQRGDRLWVRETWAYGIHALNSRNAEQEGPWVYRADDASEQGRLCDRWHPSIHMPRWASRIMLEITGVRVERLQDIGADDAYAEGAAQWAAENAERLLGEGEKYRNIVQAYKALWQSINGPDAWDENPWVWVVEFKRVEGGEA